MAKTKDPLFRGPKEPPKVQNKVQVPHPPHLAKAKVPHKAVTKAKEAAAGSSAAAARPPKVTAKRPASDIDDIFGQFATNKAARGRADEAATDAAAAEEQEELAARGSRKKRGPKEPASAFEPPSRSERIGWVDDGLGGVHNQEGWTGRKTEDGMRIFKTQLLQNSKHRRSGGGPDCPFDCDCCYV
ncbi:hypothetical protein T492DRAFT_1049855 [Pavlovales sp. CCMP2436]|nr:hypothetical protein T492DRAFT_1049855 [Pavlovales sp. CCMP2436]